MYQIAEVILESSLIVENGGLVTARTLYASLSDLGSAGNGTISAAGIVSDVDLLFDATHGISKQFFFGTGGLLSVQIDGTGALGAGYKGAGTIRVADGATVTSGSGVLGCLPGSNGMAVVTGQGSQWIPSGGLSVGRLGAGTLLIENGGEVKGAVADIGAPGVVGTATVRGAGSKWTNSGKITVGDSGIGTLDIEDGALVTSSGDAILGQATDSSGTVNVKGAGSAWSHGGRVFIGYLGTAALNVSASARVNTGECYLGGPGVCTATVAGSGSTWSTSNLYVGYNSRGTLRIEDGAQVNCTAGTIGRFGEGTATVTGTGSSWTNSGELRLGDGFAGALTVENGGKVMAASLTAFAPSAVNIHVSNNNMLVLGNATTAGTVSNAGKIDLYSDAFLTADTYTPISDLQGRPITWSGTGTYNAFGGTWDSANRKFIVPAAAGVGAGQTATLATATRTIFTDAGGHRAGVSTGAVTGTPTMVVSPMSGGQLSGIGLLPGEAVVAAWDFNTTLTGETLLSFDVGPGLTDLRAWRYSGGAWAPFDTHVVYREGIASFSVAQFSGYAVSAVPEPATWTMLLAGTAAIALHRWRKRPA